MEVFINELSVSGQFPDPSAFRSAMEALLALRARRLDLQRALYCSRAFSIRPATAQHSVQEAIRATRDQSYIRLVLGWLGRAGPFWDDDRFFNPDDYFNFNTVDVTDQGLGEAARRILGNLEAGTFSFLDPVGRFGFTPLVVVHGLQEEPLDNVDVPNVWSLDDLERVIDVRPESWDQMLRQAEERFDQLVLSADVRNYLHGYPFNSGIADRVFALLEVLQTLARETNEDQSFTEIGLETWQKHSVGDKAWFTDESATNKRRFRRDLTFRDPESGADIFCPWHGKIKIDQFRIHFEWPRPSGQRLIRVFYIGPKITVG